MFRNENFKFIVPITQKQFSMLTMFDFRLIVSGLFANLMQPFLPITKTIIKKWLFIYFQIWVGMCLLSLVCIWFAYAPFWIQLILSDFFWVCD